MNNQLRIVYEIFLYIRIVFADKENNFSKGRSKQKIGGKNFWVKSFLSQTIFCLLAPFF